MPLRLNASKPLYQSFAGIAQSHSAHQYDGRAGHHVIDDESYRRRRPRGEPRQCKQSQPGPARTQQLPVARIVMRISMLAGPVAFSRSTLGAGLMAMMSSSNRYRRGSTPSICRRGWGLRKSGQAERTWNKATNWQQISSGLAWIG